MIRKQIVLPSPREDVWEALTDPERLEDWFANEVELDLREGGDATFRWGNGEERHATITEVDPERRLAFEWDDEGEVEFTLDDDATDAADGRRDGAGVVDRARPAGISADACLIPSARCSVRWRTRAAGTCSATSPTGDRLRRRS
jgi:Uncharacterized conserved protein